MRTSKQMWKWVAMIAGAVGVLLSPALVAAKTYRNQEFGFVVPLPKGLPVCAGEKFSHEHGLNIFLDGSKAECNDALHRRAISIFAFYNVTDDTDTLDDLLRWTCDQV